MGPQIGRKPIESSNPSRSASKSAILLEKMSYLAFCRDFRGLAAAIAQLVH
jgi:hypothetical protein